MLRTLMICAAMVGACATAGWAQSGEALERTVLQETTYPGEKTTTVLMLIEVEPNVVVVKHSHPGIETGYVLEGELDIAVDGQPAKTLKVGESYLTPPAAPHIAKSGSHGAKVIARHVRGGEGQADRQHHALMA